MELLEDDEYENEVDGVQAVVDSLATSTSPQDDNVTSPRKSNTVLVCTDEKSGSVPGFQNTIILLFPSLPEAFVCPIPRFQNQRKMAHWWLAHHLRCVTYP